jgi:hypothetical protein
VLFSTPGKLAYDYSALFSEFGGNGFIPGIECATKVNPKTWTTSSKRNWWTWNCQWSELGEVLQSVELLVRLVESYWLVGKHSWGFLALIFVLSTSCSKLDRSSTVSCFAQLLARTDSEQSMLETSCHGYLVLILFLS